MAGCSGLDTDSNIELGQNESVNHTSQYQPTEKTLPDISNASYGNNIKQKFDYYAPGSGTSDTLIIVVHGGAWTGGDKKFLAGVSGFFAGRGYSVVDMNYRLAPMYKYPAPLEDIATVINYVGNQSDEFGLSEGYQIVLLGHSAGAHLVSLYGLREAEFGTKNVEIVVGLAGLYDFANGIVDSESDLGKFLGSASPAEASPASQIGEGESTKYLLIHGTDDSSIPSTQTTLFDEALQEKNVPVETLLVDGRDHFGIMEQIPQDDEVAEKIIEFIG